MRVALYARVSTTEQAIHGLSLEAQIHVLREWAKEHTVVGEYVDEGISARSPAKKRPELQRMLRDCEAGKIDLIVFTKLDRFFRNIKEYYKCQDILDAHGVAWRAIHEDYETQTAAGRLKVNIMLAVAQDEADRTSERIKAVFEDKRRKGVVPTGKVPLGIQLIEGHYAPSPEADKVVTVYNDYINTRSANETARRNGLTSQGCRYMLSNKNYLTAGVVDEHTWKTVQQIRQTRGQRRVRTDRVFIFSGLVMCPHCGARLTAMFSNGCKYYRCQRHYDNLCEGFNVSELKLEKYCLSNILPSVKEYNVTIKDKQKKPVDIGALKAKRDKLTDLYMNDLITREKYADDFKAISAAIDEAERKPKPVNVAEVKTVLQAYKGLSDVAKKAFWSRIIEHIEPMKETGNFRLFYTNGYITDDILTFVKMESEEKC